MIETALSGIESPLSLVIFKFMQHYLSSVISNNTKANMYDDNNIFAKILREEIPCIKVYEDDSTLAFMDIMPQVDGHTLVIPKVAAETLFDLPDEAVADLICKVKYVATAVKKSLNSEGIRVVQFNGSAAGQTVPHIHFHIIPSSRGSMREHASEIAEQSRLEEFAEKIRSGFSD